MPTVVQTASGIYYDILREPSDISTTFIESWLKSNIGVLNNHIYSSYVVTTGEFDPLLGDKEASIYKTMYLVNYYDKQFRAALGSASVNLVQEVDEFGAKVRFVNRNDISKSYLALRKDVQENLDNLITAYNIGAAAPQAVAGDDVTTSDGRTVLNSRDRTYNP